jgi:hypothetical protein
VRDFQWAADIGAETIVVMADFWRLDAGNRVRPCVERGIFVAIIKSESDSVYLLAKKSSSAATAKLSAARATATKQASTAATSSSESLPAFA